MVAFLCSQQWDISLQKLRTKVPWLGNYLLDYLLEGVAGATLAAYETGGEGMR